MNRQSIFTALFAIIFVTFTAMAADEAPPDTTPKVVVRERTVYVPYEKLKETFEKEGKGVFLPYEEFLKLWNAAQPREKPPEEIKPPADAVISGGSYVGTAKETSVQFEVTYKINALGKNWSLLALPMKNVAVETVTLSDPKALFAPAGDGYVLILPKPGEYTLGLTFSVKVDSKPGQRKIEFGIPPTAVSRLEMTIPEKDLRVEVMPKMAATVATPVENATKVLAFVGNADQVTVTWMPPVSKVEKGESITIASQSMHVELGERILRLETEISYKIERNEEDLFRVRLPADMRLLSVKGNNIRDWSSDNGVLQVHLHSAAKDNYALALRFERILEKTPEKLEMPFPATVGTLREDGFITVGQEQGLRLRVESSSGISQIDPRELPDALKQPNLLAGFRYLAQPLALLLNVEQIKAQIQSTTTSVISMGPDEDNIIGWVDYEIAKVGIFTLRLKFENRWEVVTIGDPQTVEDFQTAVDGQYKIVTVNLKNKALGTFRLPFKLSGPSRAAAGELVLETVQVLDTQQDKGLLGVSAPKAFKLTTVERTKMSSADVQKLVAGGLLAQLPADFDLPLAYSFTQQPSSVKIALERRQTEIRVTGFHTTIVSESGLEMTDRLEYFIAFAGVDRLQYSLPASIDEKLFEVTCPGFKEKKKASEQKIKDRTVWEISLQDKVLGSISVTLVHKENLSGLDPEKPREIPIPVIQAEDVASQSGFVVVRKEGALEIEPKAANLETLETLNLPPEMRTNKDSNVYLAYKYFQPEHSLSLKLTKHVPIEVANTIVDLMNVTFVVTEEKKIVVSADLWVENTMGEQYLELKLPENAAIRALAVRGANVAPLKREGGGTLVKLAAGTVLFPVQIVYEYGKSENSLGAIGSIDLNTLEVFSGVPAHSVPVNKIEADVYVPDDYAYMGFGGTLHLRRGYDRVSNTLMWINNSVRAQKDPVEVRDGDASRFGQLQPLGGFVPQGRLFRFQTLARVGSLLAVYCSRKLFWLFDIVVFLLALTAGYVLTRKNVAAPLWICAASILIPLSMQWFITSDLGEIFAAWLCAGILLSGGYLISAMRTRWSNWREASLRTAPDPFLEEAPEKSTEQSTPASAEAPGTAQTDEEPPVAPNKPESEPEEPKPESDEQEGK